MSDQATDDEVAQYLPGEVVRRSPALIAYYKKCAAHLAPQINFKHIDDVPALLELPPPPADIEYDEDEIREIFEGFFRRQCGRAFKIRFVKAHYA